MAHVDNQFLTILRAMAAAEASDLHFVPGNRPMYRVHGRLTPFGDQPVTSQQVHAVLDALANEKIRARIESGGDADFAVQIADGDKTHRFRINVFSSRGQRAACFRAIPDRIPGFDELGFPADLGSKLVDQHDGLILVTGVTGSGKTTTIAALLQMLNARGNCRIITVEEPIEYVFPSVGESIVTQREVGSDVPSFHEGLRSGLRQDPDVLLVGEIRDRETAQLALSAAETGHLIFGTLHSADAKGAISRMVDLFPSDRHDEVRAQLSMSLRFVIAQHLLPSVEGGRRVLALEVLVANYAVRSAVRQGKSESIDSAIQSGRQDGMFTLDADLRRLLDRKLITLETARDFAKDPAEFDA